MNKLQLVAGVLLTFTSVASAQTDAQKKALVQMTQQQEQELKQQAGYQEFTTKGGQLLEVVRAAEKELYIIAPQLNKTLAQELVNHSKRIRIEVFTSTQGFKKDAFFSQLPKFGIKVYVSPQSMNDYLMISDDRLGQGKNWEAMMWVQSKYMNMNHFLERVRVVSTLVK